MYEIWRIITYDSRIPIRIQPEAHVHHKICHFIQPLSHAILSTRKMPTQYMAPVYSLGHTFGCRLVVVVRTPLSLANLARVCRLANKHARRSIFFFLFGLRCNTSQLLCPSRCVKTPVRPSDLQRHATGIKC